MPGSIGVLAVPKGMAKPHSRITSAEVRKPIGIPPGVGQKTRHSKYSFSALLPGPPRSIVTRETARKWARILVCCSTLATPGRNDAPHASPFAE